MEMTSEVEHKALRDQQSCFDWIMPKAQHVRLPFKTNNDPCSTADSSQHYSAHVLMKKRLSCSRSIIRGLIRNNYLIFVQATYLYHFIVCC